MKAGGPSNNPPELALHRLLVCLKPSRWERRWGAGRVHWGDGCWLQLTANPVLCVCSCSFLCIISEINISGLFFFKDKPKSPTRRTTGYRGLRQPAGAAPPHVCCTSVPRTLCYANNLWLTATQFDVRPSASVLVIIILTIYDQRLVKLSS